MNYKACSEETENPSIVVRENKSKFEIVNSSREKVEKIKVDGCLVNDGKKRCDWMFHVKYKCEAGSTKSRNLALYVELKGCDVDKAISQIEETLQYTEKKFKDCEKICYAVTTRVPRGGTVFQKKIIEFKRRNSVPIFIKNLNFSHALD